MKRSSKACTTVQITKGGLYLYDAGATYFDRTTDVTGTHVFGTATEEQKKVYTSVLQGSIDSVAVVFLFGIYGGSIDFLA